MTRLTSERVSPSRAVSMLLSRAGCQREPDEETVAYLAFAMSRGWWRPERDESPIEIDEYGRLVNGQHRCLAIIRYGEPVRCLIKRR